MKITSKPAGDFELTLKLSRKEATILRSIFRNVSGSMSGPRGMTNAIGDHLMKMGVPFIILSNNSHGAGLALPDCWDDEALEAAVQHEDY